MEGGKPVLRVSFDVTEPRKTACDPIMLTYKLGHGAISPQGSGLRCEAARSQERICTRYPQRYWHRVHRGLAPRAVLVAQVEGVHLGRCRPGFDPRSPRGPFFPGGVRPVTSQLVLQWLPCQTPGVLGSARRLAGLV